MFIEWVLLSCHFHPCKHDGTASGNNVHQTFILLETGCCCTVHTAVDSHEIHAVFCMHTYNIDPFFGSNFAKGFVIIYHCIVDRNSSDHCRTFRSKFAAEASGIAVGAEIHDGFSTHFYCRMYLFILHINVFPVSGNTQVYIDLGGEFRTYTAWADAFMILIAGNDHLSFRDQFS